MQILYFALDCPLPANNGLRLRTWSMLEALRAEGSRITLVCLRATAQPESRAELTAVCDSFWILDHAVTSLTQGGDWWPRVRSLFSTAPHAALRFRSPAAQQLLRQMALDRAWDAIICDTAFAAVNIPAGLAPLVVNHHNLEHRIFESFCQVEPNPCKRAAAAWEGNKVRSWESHAARRAALNLVCSNTDRDRLLALLPGANVAVVPNVVAEPPAFAAAPPEEPNLIVFPAALDWHPNRDAVDFFLAQVWPRVRAQAPQARFLAAGRNPPASLLERHRRQSGVGFTGTVADMQPYLARAAVIVVPLRIGSGTRLKILEAAAMSKPVVSTSLGAEGLDFVPGSEIALADEPEAMAAELVALLARPEKRHALGRAAHARFRAAYCPLALQRSLHAALQQLPPAPEAVHPLPTPLRRVRAAAPPPRAAAAELRLAATDARPAQGISKLPR